MYLMCNVQNVKNEKASKGVPNYKHITVMSCSFLLYKQDRLSSKLIEKEVN